MPKSLAEKTRKCTSPKGHKYTVVRRWLGETAEWTVVLDADHHARATVYQRYSPEAGVLLYMEFRQSTGVGTLGEVADDLAVNFEVRA